MKKITTKRMKSLYPPYSMIATKIMVSKLATAPINNNGYRTWKTINNETEKVYTARNSILADAKTPSHLICTYKNLLIRCLPM